MLAVSCAVHLALIALAAFVIAHKPAYRPFPPSVINVTMVSFPSSRPEAKSPGPAAAKVETPAEQKIPEPAPKEKPPVPPVEEKPVPAPAKPEAVSVAKKTEPVKPKESLKKKTFKPEKVVESAVKRIEAKAESTKPDSLAQALDRLKKDVAKGPPNQAAGSALPAGAGPLAGGQGGGEGGTVWEVYANNIVAEQVQKNWAFSEQLAGKIQNAKASLVFTIAPSGEIVDIWFDTRSGNAYLDESAYRAVKKSNPLPPPPAGKSSLTVGLSFTPAGVQ
ncbi:MAG: TonB family protein [Desulfobacterales bacterium]|nr:TonB family protein [Desulfobacterales bacterium]